MFRGGIFLRQALFYFAHRRQDKPWFHSYFSAMQAEHSLCGIFSFMVILKNGRVSLDLFLTVDKNYIRNESGSQTVEMIQYLITIGC